MENNGQLEWRRFDDLSHIEKPHYKESIFLQKLPPGLRVGVGADGIQILNIRIIPKNGTWNPCRKISNGIKNTCMTD